MKRLSESEIRKRNSFFLVSAIVIFALSVTAIASLLTNYIDPPYEKLPETATTVEKTVYEHGVIVPFFGHLGEKTYLTASDGSAYAIPKSLHTSGALSEGEEVVINTAKLGSEVSSELSTPAKYAQETASSCRILRRIRET